MTQKQISDLLEVLERQRKALAALAELCGKVADELSAFHA